MDSASYSLKVTENVRIGMRVAGMTATDLATLTGISRQTLGRRLAPINPSPLTVSELKAIADALGTTARDLATVAISAEMAVA